MQKKYFTLVELMVVVVIIGIMATLAVPSFAKYKERVYDKEAKALLAQFLSAQKKYMLQENISNFYACNTSDCDSYFNLELVFNQGNWVVSASNDLLQLQRYAGNNPRVWRIELGSEEPVCSGTCL